MMLTLFNKDSITHDLTSGIDFLDPKDFPRGKSVVPFRGVSGSDAKSMVIDSINNVIEALRTDANLNDIRYIYRKNMLQRYYKLAYHLRLQKQLARIYACTGSLTGYTTLTIYYIPNDVKIGVVSVFPNDYEYIRNKTMENNDHCGAYLNQEFGNLWVELIPTHRSLECKPIYHKVDLNLGRFLVQNRTVTLMRGYIS